MDDRVDIGKQWLENLLQLMGIPAIAVTEGFPTIAEDKDSCWLNITTDSLSDEQVKLVIGEKGKNIDAIQYLVNTILNITQDSDHQGSYTVELNAYRVTRYKELLEIVDRATAQVRETGRETEIAGLSSAERRQIHAFFQDSEDLTTESRGQEPDRKLIVKLAHSSTG